MLKTFLTSSASQTGDSTELHTLAELVFMGFTVFRTGDKVSCSDLIVELGSSILRIQVKTMFWNPKELHYRVRTCNRGGKWPEAEIFVFYCRQENEYFVVPYNEATRFKELTWRPTLGTRGRKPMVLTRYKRAWHLLYEVAGVTPTPYQLQRIEESKLQGGG